MASLSDFAKRMTRLGSTIEDNADQVVRKAVLAVDQAVVLATPVDKGRARSNWVAELDTAFSGEVEPYVPGEGGSTGGANAQAAMNQAAATAAKYDGDRHSEVHITNNLPYIQALNDGHSAQAPADFVGEAIQAGAAAVRGARLLED